MKNLASYFFLIMFHSVCFSQVPIGSWKSHLPASSFNYIGNIKDKVYAANSSGVLVYDQAEESVYHLTKINQLVDAGISTFSCDQTNGACVVGYENGNIDIITSDGSIKNQPALKNNPVVGNKKITDIIFHDNQALLSSGVGIISLDLESYNITSDRRFTINGDRLEVQTLGLYLDTIFIASNMGLYKASINGIFENESITEVDLDFNGETIQQFIEFQEELYVLQQIDSTYKGDTLHVYEGNKLTSIPFQEGEGIRHLSTYGDSLIVTRVDNIALYNKDLEFQSSIFTFGLDGGLDTYECYFINSNEVIIADANFGGAISSFTNQFNSNVFGLSSPSTDLISVVEAVDDYVFAFPGGTERTFNLPLVHSYQNQEWNTFSLNDFEIPRVDNTNGITYTSDGFFISTERQGIAQLDDQLEVLELYDYNNSSIQDAFPTIPNYEYGGITGISEIDDAVYALNNLAANPLIVRTPEGEWLNVRFNELSSPKTGDIVASSNGYLALNMVENGLVIYNTKNTHSDLTDDEYRLLTTSSSSGNLPSNNVTSIAFDKDGELWIGTDAGIAVIYSIESVFNNNFSGAQQIIVNQDGYNGYLFETETVEAIVIDGADRKWVGTSSSGLFLVSSDGQEQIHHFTKENSPMLSNLVYDLCIEPKTGEVFIASDKGLISYRGDATEGAAINGDISVFPNPVKPDFNGQIAIDNLTENSYVRITDSAGNLVYETTALGGQAIWNGLNRNGEKAASGVYLVFASSADGSAGQVGKILIL